MKKHDICTYIYICQLCDDKIIGSFDDVDN